MNTAVRRSGLSWVTWASLLLGLLALVAALAAISLVLRPRDTVPTPTASASPSTSAELVRGEPANAPPYDAILPPVSGDTTHQITLVARETEQEVAPGVIYPVWTFGDHAPGPPLRVRQGDTIEFTLRNDGKYSHSMDFHAAQTPWDRNYHSISPGETISFTWQANYPGVFLYHCGTGPALLHIANGMYGAIIVDPAEALPPAREFVLVQSEFYAKPSADRTHNEWDFAKMLADTPDLVVFNGTAQQYADHPLQAQPGELVCLWVVNAGPSQPSAFHVVGAIFDTVYPDGNPANILRGVQTYNIPPGGGARLELRVPEEGLYPVVSHSFASAQKGALGMLRVGNPAGAPEPASH
jgi:nitrite reductase (NO-forming)